MSVHTPQYYFAVALDASYDFELSESTSELKHGDFLVFNENNLLLTLKKDDFRKRFRHADGRGSYVYIDSDSTSTGKSLSGNEETEVSHCNDNSTDVSNTKLENTSCDVSTLLLNQDNSSKWIQKSTILAFSLTENVVIRRTRSGTGVRDVISRCEGSEGDILVVHLSGFIEKILPGNLFHSYFSFLKLVESDAEISVSINDVNNISCESDSDSSSGHQATTHRHEVTRLYPILAREMRETFHLLPSPDSLFAGQSGDYLVQEAEAFTERGAITSLSSKITLSASDTRDSNALKLAVTNGHTSSQWILSPSEIHELFFRVEEEKEIRSIALSGRDDTPDEMGEVSLNENKEYNLMPTDAFLPHYKCWEGVVYKRTRLTHQWRATYGVLYPNRLELGCEFPIVEGKASIRLQDVDEELKKPVQTMHLVYSSLHPSTVNDKEVIFVDNVVINEPIDIHQSIPPYSTAKKTAVRRIVKLASVIGATIFKTSTDKNDEIISEGRGIYLSPATLPCSTFHTLLSSAVLYARREMALGATKAGDCARVLHILQSVSPSEALSILQTLCPFDSSPGMLIQHEAAKTSLPLLKVLFPVKNDSVLAKVQSFSEYLKELDISAFSSSGFTCLHYAVLANNIEVVMYLILNKCFEMSTNSKTRCGKTPLHLARGRDVTSFLMNCGSSLDAEDDDGSNPLMSLIAFGGYDAVITFLEQSGGKDKFDINAKSWLTGLSVLSVAIRTFGERIIDIVERLLQMGADPNSSDLKNNTPLHEAASLFLTLSRVFAADENAQQDMTACVQVINMLIHAGADISNVNEHGMTPFLLLCHANCFPFTAAGDEVIDLLTTPVNGGDDDRIEAFLNCRAADGSCPLHNVVEKGNSSLLEALIRKGANVNCKDLVGRTPLDIVHTAQGKVGSTTPLHVVNQLIQCLTILTQNRALKRLRKDIPMEVDQPTMKFISSSSQAGLYEVKSATLKAMLDRLCSELFYSNIDAEALLFSLHNKNVSNCDAMLNIIVSNYPSKITASKLSVKERDTETSLLKSESGDNSDDEEMTSNESRSGSRTSIVMRCSRRASRFLDARENSPGGLLLLIQIWFELNPDSIGKFHDLLCVLRYCIILSVGLADL